MSCLALVRHGESTWNAKGLWAGLTDVGLTEKGKKEARQAGEALKKIHFDKAYTSSLIRAWQTLDEIKKVLGEEDLSTQKDPALNERDYGDFTGRNKWQVERKMGKEKFSRIRRSWDYPIPNGESLKDVYKRVVPYYAQHILPDLKKGLNILVSAHGNSLRALIKYLENISDAKIPQLELGFGEIYLYQVDQNGQIITKKILTVA